MHHSYVQTKIKKEIQNMQLISTVHLSEQREIKKNECHHLFDADSQHT